MKLTNILLYKLQSKTAKIIAILILFAMPFKIFAQDQVYAQRLAALRSQTELIYNQEVKKHIEFYIQNPAKTRDLIALSKYYFPILEKHLRAKGLPTDLKYLAVSSSELNPTFSNANGASGIWTMSYTVSKMYKLKVNTYVDERRDINKSSAVFAQHFKDLYSIYKQWPLVIGAYGCSPISMNKSIRMAGNSLYYWDIFNYLPTNCRDLYPQFVAATYILNYYKEHGIKPSNHELNFEFDSVLINKALSFQQISSTLKIPIEDLRKLNPKFRKDVVPMAADGYFLKLPKEKSSQIDLLRDSFYNPVNLEFAPLVIQNESLANAPAIQISQKIKPADLPVEKAQEKNISKTKVFYTVKRKDVLGDIADWFDVSVSEIKKQNKLKSDRVKQGQKLSIFVPANKSGYYKRINKMQPNQKKKLKKKD